MVECRGLNLLYLEIGASSLLSGESNLVFVMLVSLLGVVVRRVVVSLVGVSSVVVCVLIV